MKSKNIDNSPSFSKYSLYWIYTSVKSDTERNLEKSDSAKNNL